MRIRSKIALITGGVFLSVALISSLSVWTMNRTTRLRDTIVSGLELISEARRLHGLMKDLMFDLFTPQTYRLLKDVLHTPRFQTTRQEFRVMVTGFETSVSVFMSSQRLQTMLRDRELRDTHQIARVMIDKASLRIRAFETSIERLVAEGLPGDESLYQQIQTQEDPTIQRLFGEARETSYYLSNTFEGFLSRFIRSLESEAAVIRSQILFSFWTLTLLIGGATLAVSLAFARRIVARIKEVEGGVRAVSRGDFTARLDARSRDELGALARNFNVFMEDLKRHVDSVLRLIRGVGESLTHHSGLDRILELVVEGAVHDSHADGAAVLTRGPDGRLEVARHAGSFPYAAGQHIAHPSEGAGQIDPYVISRSGQPFFARGRATLAPGFDVASFLAVPVAVPRGTPALLCALTVPGEPALTDLDFTNFTTFARYAELIIDNFFTYKELLERREARHRALQSQIQPHFLYNVLGGLVGLNRMGDGAALEDAIFSLKDMLRYTLEQESWTTVADELRFVERYCALQKMRFEERLSVHIRCEDEASGFRIPRLILQPVVENAVIHGIEPLDRPGCLTIHARLERQDGHPAAVITVQDNGPGFDPETVASHIGLRNVRERLGLICPHARLVVDSSPGAGTRITMLLDANGAGT
jgi:sensor histidine kinase YesM